MYLASYGTQPRMNSQLWHTHIHENFLLTRKSPKYLNRYAIATCNDVLRHCICGVCVTGTGTLSICSITHISYYNQPTDIASLFYSGTITAWPVVSLYSARQRYSVNWYQEKIVMQLLIISCCIYAIFPILDNLVC